MFVYVAIGAIWLLSGTTRFPQYADPAALTVLDLPIPTPPANATPKEPAVPADARHARRRAAGPVPEQPLPVIRLLDMAAPKPPPVITVMALDDKTIDALAAPVLPTPSIGSADGPDSWEGRILATLDEHKHYPRSAQVMRREGVVLVRFVLDRQGALLSAGLDRSSGVAELDREALALLRRACPFPRVPDSRSGDRFELIAPIEFMLH